MALVTRTLHKPGGGGTDYTLITQWESTEGSAHLDGDDHRLEIYAQDENIGGSYLYIDGWNAETTEFTITLVAIDRHGGVSKADGGSGYRLQNSGSSFVIRSNTSTINIAIDGIELLNGTSGPCLTLGSGNAYIDKCMLFAPNAGAYIGNIGGSGKEGHVTNTLARGGGFDTNSSGANFHVKNCTLAGVSGTYGVNGGAEFHVQRTMSRGFDSADIRGYSSSNAFNNGTGDNTANNWPNGQVSVSDVDFVDYANGDYRPAEDGKLHGTGGTPEFALDIADNPRNTPDDIGAYVVGGGGPILVKEMYTNISNVWTKATPNLRIGGAWQTVTAYVRSAGAWVKVHDK